MSAVNFRSAGLGPLRSADLSLSPGRYVVMSSETDAVAGFVAVAAGRAIPSHGQVDLDGAFPATSPATRRRIAALFEDETLPPARSVEASMARALVARADRAEGAAAALEAAGLKHLAAQSPRALNAREARSVALALALTHDAATLFVLYEPLTTLIEPAHVLEVLDRQTARGAIVVATTSSAADAHLLGGGWLCLEFGRLAPTTGPAPRLGRGPWQQIVVEASDTRALSRLLHDSPLGLTTELAGVTAQLRVSGAALDDTVREVISIARQHDIEVSRIEPSLPPVEALLAARAGFARGVYEASRQVAHTMGPAPTPVAARTPDSFGGGPT